MRVITEEELLRSLFAEIQSIELAKGSCHYGDYTQWCIFGKDVEQAIKNLFAEEGVFKPTKDCKVVHKHRALNRNIKQIPAADAVEVRHGEWLEQYEGSRLVKCSVCGYEYCDLIECDNYCGNCGAKMDGGGKEENEG